MIRILMVEDSSRDKIIYQRALSDLKEVSLLSVESGETALALLQKQQVDLFFLDVDLPGMDGFQLARNLRGISTYELTPIIFITGYVKNPLPAFGEFHCYDFISKPILIQEFASKVRELIEKLQRQNDAQYSGRNHLAAFETPLGIRYIPVSEILFAETHRNDAILSLVNGSLPLPGMSLKEVIRSVDDPDFLQCHKSFAVNVRQIMEVRRISYRLSRLILLHTDVELDMSMTYGPQVRARLAQLGASNE